MCFASTSVTIPSNRANSFTVSSTKNVCATGAGSAARSLDNYAIQLQRPFLDAIGEFLKYFHQILANGTTNTAIHRLNNLLLALHLRVLLQKRASIPTSPNSFSITAVFFLCVAVKMRLSKVVLSEPRKPVKTVTGTLVSSSAFSFVIVSVSAVVWMSSVDSLAGV